MKRLPKQSLITSLTLLLLQCIFLVNIKADSINSEKPVMSFNEAYQLRFQNPDTTLTLLDSYYKYAISVKDTALAIRSLMRSASVFGHQARYKESYDLLWTALLLADASGKEDVKSSIYRALGRHYSFYNRKENAIKFLTLSIDIKRELIEKGEFEQARIAENYHAFCATYRELNQPDMGQKYLDSSFLHHEVGVSIVKKPYLHFEQAVLHNINGKYEEALTIFNDILPWFTENIPSYNVLIYNYLGDTYHYLDNFARSEDYYLKALQTSEEYNSHIDFTPLVYQRMARLYFAHNEYQKGYESLDKARELDLKFFDSRSEYNRSLLEIQDAFRLEKEEQAILQQKTKIDSIGKGRGSLVFTKGNFVWFGDFPDSIWDFIFQLCQI